MIVVVAEKPSVAKDIAWSLGATERKNGYFRGETHLVTWALGHLVGLPNPEEILDAWGAPWRAQALPMLPTAFPLRVLPSGKDQFEVIKRLLRDRATKSVICATDAGREGELIFRYIYERSGCRLPWQRLWISSLTPNAIRDGFAQLRNGRHFDALGDAARARAVADWLVGMNLSRAYTLASGELLAVGRVQTPTLALVVARDRAIAAHKPEVFRKVRVRLATEAGAFQAIYVRRLEDPKSGEPKDDAVLPPAGTPGLSAVDDADVVVGRARIASASIVAVERVDSAAAPPKLFDLTELQRTANRLWGWTAKQVLATAQELYETHKVLSYPRTDSRHLSSDLAPLLPGVVEAIAAPYRALLAEGTGRRPLPKRFVDDSKVSDHHAIIPTGTAPRGLVAGTPAHQLYDLVCRRFLQAWQEDAIEAVTTVRLELQSEGFADRYVARGRTWVRLGWRALELQSSSQQEQDSRLPAGLRARMAVNVAAAEVLEGQTRPKEPFTDATLLSAMELAGASLPEELAEAMKARGLGTPATRAATIETLLSRGYLVRQGKSLRATEAGSRLVDAVHPHVCSPALTGEWEERLRRLERGEESYAAFVDDVARFVKTTVEGALVNGVAPRSFRPAAKPAAPKSKSRSNAPRRKAAAPRVSAGRR